MASGFRPFDAIQGIETLVDMWNLAKDGKRLTCAILTHPLGWELKVRSGHDEFLRSEVCKDHGQVFDTADAWKAEAIAKGFAELP